MVWVAFFSAHPVAASSPLLECYWLGFLLMLVSVMTDFSPCLFSNTDSEARMSPLSMAVATPNRLHTSLSFSLIVLVLMTMASVTVYGFVAMPLGSLSTFLFSSSRLVLLW